MVVKAKIGGKNNPSSVQANSETAHQKIFINP